MLKTKSSLTARVTLWLTLFSGSLFAIIGSLTFVVVLAYEDAMLHKMLRYVSQQEVSMEGVVSKISIDELIEFGYQLQTTVELRERTNTFGEFAKDDQYFHFMVLDNGVLLMNSTHFVMSSDRLKSIITLLITGFFPCLLLAFWLSRLIARRSLKPFSLLREQFLIPERQAANIHQFNQSIRETDIKEIANGLAVALAQKETLLEQQITFNQGMSHELRTPLQVMTHAVELLALKVPDLQYVDAYQRLSNSIHRMHRMSEALLWLTSSTVSQEQVQVNQQLALMRDDIEHTFHQHRLKIHIVEDANLNFIMPKAVFEFMIYSLATNTVHHSSANNSDKLLNIIVTETSLTLNNRIDSNPSLGEDTQSHFGIGMIVIEKLCRRFNIKHSVTGDNQQYTVTLSLMS